MDYQLQIIKPKGRTSSKKSSKESKTNSEPHNLNINPPTKHNKLP